MQTNPAKDANNFELLEAMEMGEYTHVKFERNLTTGEATDVQFMVRLYNKYSSSVCGGTPFTSSLYSRSLSKTYELLSFT